MDLNIASSVDTYRYKCTILFEDIVHERKYTVSDSCFCFSGFSSLARKFVRCKDTFARGEDVFGRRKDASNRAN